MWDVGKEIIHRGWTIRAVYEGRRKLWVTSDPDPVGEFGDKLFSNDDGLDRVKAYIDDREVEKLLWRMKHVR